MTYATSEEISALTAVMQRHHSSIDGVRRMFNKPTVEALVDDTLTYLDKTVAGCEESTFSATMGLGVLKIGKTFTYAVKPAVLFSGSLRNEAQLEVNGVVYDIPLGTATELGISEMLEGQRVSAETVMAEVLELLATVAPEDRFVQVKVGEHVGIVTYPSYEDDRPANWCVDIYLKANCFM